MPIPRKRIPVRLKTATPTAITPEGLKKQLTNIGLTCPASAESKLAQYVADVKALIPNGVVETYGIFKPASTNAVRAPQFATDLTDSSTGNWEPDSEGMGYETTLEYIQYGAHFDWLKSNRPEFTGTEDNPPQYSGNFSTIDGIKQMFVNVGTDASATLVKGLDKLSIESVLSNAIAPLNDQNAANYDVPDSRVIFLVDNYDPNTQEADGIGVLTIEWHLTIQDFKNKSKDPVQHQTSLTVKSRSVLYSNTDVMNADYLAAQAQFKGSAFLAIPNRANVTIFPALPPADESTFISSLPKKQTTDKLEVIVLYAANLQNIGSIDNTNSDTTTSYSQSVTSGFTFSASQTLSVEASFEASAEVVKVGFKVSLSLSFTEQWSTSQTVGMNFEVPGGKKAFTYQGYLMARVLSYDPQGNSYSYNSETARFLTNTLMTSRTPLTDPTPEV